MLVYKTRVCAACLLGSQEHLKQNPEPFTCCLLDFEVSGTPSCRLWQHSSSSLYLSLPRESPQWWTAITSPHGFQPPAPSPAHIKALLSVQTPEKLWSSPPHRKLWLQRSFSSSFPASICWREEAARDFWDSGGTGKMHLAGPDTPSPSTPPWISIGGFILLAGLSRIGPIQMAGLLEVSLLVAALWPLCWTRVSCPLKRRRLATSNSSATQTGQECRVNKAEVACGQLPVWKWHEVGGRLIYKWYTPNSKASIFFCWNLDYQVLKRMNIWRKTASCRCLIDNSPFAASWETELCLLRNLVQFARICITMYIALLNPI